MRVLTLLLIGGVALSSWGCSSSGKPGSADGNEPGKEQMGTLAGPGAPVTYRVSGPYSHENLSLYLIHGDEQLVGRELLPLGEAMQQKKAILHETGNVQELAIENVSDEVVYIQAGDIVKGGQQDRVLSRDVVLEPGSGRVSLASFCVEQGRWGRRGNEDVQFFGSSGGSLPGKALKLAAKRSGDQQQVWDQVKVTRSRLALASDTALDSSSLQLALDTAEVQSTAAPYEEALKSCVEGKNDAIGLVLTIDGQLNSADVYASHALFLKLFPRLLKASALEAVASEGASGNDPVPDAQTVLTWLEAGMRIPGLKPQGDPLQGIQIVTGESAEDVFFETRTTGNEGWIHRNLIRK